MLILLTLIGLNQFSDLFAAEAIGFNSQKAAEIDRWVERQTSINDSLRFVYSKKFSPEKKKKPKEKVISKFEFNPNTVSEKELQQLGFSSFAIKNTIRFRDKNGVFHSKTDVKKIYGVSDQFYSEIENLIQLPETDFQRSDTTSSNDIRAKKNGVNINTADTAELKKLPGIGTKLAARIVAYRNLLGGFRSTEQLKEVYGLPEETWEKNRSMIFCDEIIVPININTCDAIRLGEHPYISRKKAEALMNYRAKHGLFHSVSDVEQTGLFDEESFRKIAPYLTTE